MPRRPRFEAPGAFHHAVPQGNNRERIVLDDHDRAELVRHLAGAVARHGWRCHAYCLLDTHLHLLLETPRPNLGAGMGRLLGGYARWFNRRRSREGHLFATPFYSRRVEVGEHLVAAMLYIVMNPVRAGLCRHPREWPWSSFPATSGGVASFVETELVHGMLAADPEEARARFRALVDERAGEIAREERPVRR